MISVVIPTRDSERALLPTLAALVPGAMAGLVREVIVAAAGSRDDTATVADVAGCRFLEMPGTRGAQIRAGAAAARAPWLLLLRPGAVPDVTWIDEVDRFIRGSEPGRSLRAAVFRRASGDTDRSMVMEALSLLAAALAKHPRPEQGLLIPKQLYDAIGAHRADAADAEADFIRRLGRRRIVTLRSGVTLTGA